MLTDPWSPAPPRPRRASVRPRAIGAALLGLFGPAVWTIRDSVIGWTSWVPALAALVVAAVLLELLLRRTPRDARVFALLAVVAVATVAVSWVTFGRAAAVVLLLGVVVADGALVGWRPPVRDLPREPIAGVALPLVALAEVSFARSGSLAVSGALLVVGLGAVEWTDRFPATSDRVGRTMAHGIRVAAEAIGTALVLVLVGPVLWIGGIPSRVVRRVRHPRGVWHDPRSTWRVRRTSVVDDRRDSTFPFASTDPRTRAARHGAGLVGVVVIAAAFWVLHDSSTTTTDSAHPPTPQAASTDVKASSLPAFKGVPWADALKDEQTQLNFKRLPLSPVAGFTVGDFAGKYTNTKDGERRSLASQCTGCPKKVVWFVGGSAGFGLGQRDEHTIASDLVRLGDEKGVNIEMHNIGVPGYTIWQEYEAVSARLALGAEKPDLIVFYDGFNEIAFGAARAKELGKLPPLEPWSSSVVTFETLGQLSKDPSLGAVGGPAAFAADVVRKYQGIQQLIDQLAAARGIDVAYFFQPDALASPRQLDALNPGFGTQVPFEASPDLREVFDKASKGLEQTVHDLRPIFDDYPDPVFIDPSHTNETGAQVVADSIFATIAPQLGVAPS